MPPPVDQGLVTLAVEWAREAGTVTLDWFRATDLEVQHKTDGSPVTAADRAAERLLRDRIQARFPDDTITRGSLTSSSTASISARGSARCPQVASSIQHTRSPFRPICPTRSSPSPRKSRRERKTTRMRKK